LQSSERYQQFLPGACSAHVIGFLVFLGMAYPAFRFAARAKTASPRVWTAVSLMLAGMMATFLFVVIVGGYLTQAPTEDNIEGLEFASLSAMIYSVVAIIGYVSSGSAYVLAVLTKLDLYLDKIYSDWYPFWATKPPKA